MFGLRLRVLGAALVLALTATVTAVATHDQKAGADPLFVEWPALLPGLTDGFSANSSNVCVSGKIGCIDALVREMQKRYEPLRDSCSDQALFALTYLRVTQTYAWSARQPGYYTDVAWTNHIVAVFAKYYLRAFDAWNANPADPAVPQAWKTAFNGAQSESLMGTGNFILGLNAHINHDLALAMAAGGLAGTSGLPEKANYDKIDALLNSVTLPLVAELAARFDPSMDDTTLPLNLDSVAIGNLMFAWREQAWRNAELITVAPALTKPAVQAVIDANSITQATLYATAFAVAPTAPSRVTRSQFCRLHHDDQAPQSYPFGLPTD